MDGQEAILSPVMNVEGVEGTRYSICCGQFRTRIAVWVRLILEDPTVTVKSRTAIKALFLYFDLCLNVILDSLRCSSKNDNSFTLC
jgi:hypothetical protein